MGENPSRLMRDPDLAQYLISLCQKDLEKREELAKTGALFEGYHPEMEAVHIANAKALEEIIAAHGWPHEGLVGAQASEAAWIIAQHAIGLPDFQRRVLKLLKSPENTGRIPPQQIACMEDRILSFEGKEQIYGTQFDWDDKGELSPNPVRDIAQVDERRASVGLKPLSEATKDMRDRAKAEGEKPPANHAKRKAEADQWARKAGWR